HTGSVHPYTRGLLTSFPRLTGPRRKLSGIPGSPPDLRGALAGCPFIPRCRFSTDACGTVDMALIPVDADHLSACPYVTAERLDASPAPALASSTERDATGSVALEAVDLSKRYRLGRHVEVEAVKGVSLALRRGTITALVGESGSGKTTVARLLAGQEKRSGGQILLDGAPLDPSAKR